MDHATSNRWPVIAGALRRAVLAALVGAVVHGGPALHAQAQSTAPVTKFDVSSVRRNPAAELDRATASPDRIQPPGSARTYPSGVLRAPGITVRELIREAYGYRNRPPADVQGGPSWLEVERYDVIGKAAIEFTPSGPAGVPAAAEQMLRQLLAERFQLKLREESVERWGYDLVLADPAGTLGERLVPSKGDCVGIYDPPPVMPTNPGDPLPEPKPNCMGLVGGGQLRIGHITLSDFATFLQGFPAINSTVTDKTGLQGAYDVALDFRGAAAMLNPNSRQANWPPLLQALEEQLGVKLERKRVRAQILTIESVTRPDAN